MIFVQQQDQTKDIWLKYHVASGDLVETSHKKFDGIDEIQPIVKRDPDRQSSSDPLEAFR